ncbi:MAG: TatD family hydrolase [Candidatus Magasanikbacteria bacterium]|nr:TatD family hydrolase [Candidatus Magasanikbacteria bacterium]
MDFKLFDTHSHVHFAAYKDDQAEVLARAREAGVGMITVGTMQKTSAEAVGFAQHEPDVWAAVGLHPQNIHHIHPSEDEGAGHEDFDYEFYKKLASEKKVVAIGETGMDLFRIQEGEDPTKIAAEQEMVFCRHLDLCEELSLPVIIHCRDAHAQVIQVLTKYVAAGKISRRGVLHCFTGTADQAHAYVALGFYISIPGIITFAPKKNESENALAAVVREVPRDRLVIETDCPFLTPQPHRGERNEPAYVQFTAAKISQIWGCSEQEAGETTTANAFRLFNL